MNITVNSREFKKTLSQILKFTKDAIRTDEEAIHFFNDQNHLYLEVVKAAQLQLRLSVPLINSTDSGDFFVHKVWLEQLLGSLTQDEDLNLILLGNSLNIVSQNKGSLTCELFSNPSAHDGMRVYEDLTSIEVTQQIDHLFEILKKLNMKDQRVTFLFEDGKCTVTTSFDQASYLMFKTETTDLELDLNFCATQSELNPIGYLTGEVTYSYVEDEEGRETLVFKGDNGYYVLVNSEEMDYDVEVVSDLLNLSTEDYLAKLQIPCNDLEAAIKWQSYKLSNNDSLEVSVVDGQTFLIKGSRSVEPASINCIEEGQFKLSQINLKVFEGAAKLLTSHNSQIVDFKQCELTIEGESEPIIFYVVNDQISNSYSINLLFYSSVLNE